MRLERIGPRTWLLATTAGWAVAFLLLALAGLGAHARLLADDPGLLQPLPRPSAATGARAKPLAQYDAVAARPLFMPDRRPHPFVLEGSAPGEAEGRGASFDYVLTSVLIAPPLRMAIVQPAGGGDGIRVRLGEGNEAMPGWRLVDLGPRSAVFEGPGGRQSLDLRTFDGSGGEPPSHMPAAAERQRAIEAAAAAESQAAGSAAQAADAADDAAEPSPTQVQRQADAIRKRIEARRAQLRREAAQSTANDRNP
jgi:general secretion pathway protein N